MLAGQAVVCHHAAMDCFRRANRVDQPDDMAMRLRKTASMMMRSMSDTLRALERLQSRPVPVREPDASEEIIPLATDTDAPERAFASLMPREPKKMDDAFVRERIARARKIIAEERGFTDDLPVEEDPFSPEALLAQLRAARQQT